MPAAGATGGMGMCASEGLRANIDWSVLAWAESDVCSVLPSVQGNPTTSSDRPDNKRQDCFFGSGLLFDDAFLNDASRSDAPDPDGECGMPHR